MHHAITKSLVVGTAILLTACSQHHQQQSRTASNKHVVAETYVHKYGVTVPKKEWSDRGKNGHIVSTLKTGVVVTKTYRDGYLDGETTYTFPHTGSIEKVETYAQGRLAKEQTNHSSGAPRESVEYEAPNTKIVTSWFEDGTPHSRETYQNNLLLEADYYTANHQVESRVDNGTGKRIIRNEFGQIDTVDKIELGQLVLRTVYYPNGAPKEVIPYVNGKVSGQKKTFLPGGEPSTLEAWSNDRQEGETVVFKDGEKISVVPFLNGLKNGVEHRYKDGHHIVEEVTWKNGKKSGPSYTHIGEDTHVSWYFDGQEVPKVQYDRLTNPY